MALRSPLPMPRAGGADPCVPGPLSSHFPVCLIKTCRAPQAAGAVILVEICEDRCGFAPRALLLAFVQHAQAGFETHITYYI